MRDGPTKQNPIQKTIELPKPGQTTDDDSGWRKLNVISRAGKVTGKNKHLMDMALEQSEPFWLDFEHAFPSNTEGKAREIRPTSEEEHTFGDAENNDFLL